MARYEKPGFGTKNIFNPILMFLMRFGITFKGGHTLAVPGRKSGKIQTVPVNPLEFEGKRYLVAPRGNTQWVRNVRAAGGAELRLGGKRERITAKEVGDSEKPPIIRAYLQNWESETKTFFGGVTHEATEETLREIAPNHPVFLIEPVA